MGVGRELQMSHAHTKRDGSAFEIESIDMTNPTPAQVKALAKIEHQKGVTYAIIGGLVLIAGLVVLVLGLAGQVDLSLSIGDFSAEVKTAALGIIVMLVGLVVLYMGRPDVTLRNDVVAATSARPEDTTEVVVVPDPDPAPPASS